MPMSDQVEGWVRAKDVADVTGFNERSVRRWAAEGRILARCSPGAPAHCYWRIAVDAEGWPIELLEE